MTIRRKMAGGSFKRILFDQCFKQRPLTENKLFKVFFRDFFIITKTDRQAYLEPTQTSKTELLPKKPLTI